MLGFFYYEEISFFNLFFFVLVQIMSGILTPLNAISGVSCAGEDLKLYRVSGSQSLAPKRLTC